MESLEIRHRTVASLRIAGMQYFGADVGFKYF
jgi:hypothetical protein